MRRGEPTGLGRLPLIAITVVVVACIVATTSEATAGQGRYTLAATKRCLATQHLVKRVGRTGNLVIEIAPGGAIGVVMRTRNDVALGFYRSAPDAETILALVIRVRAERGQLSPKSEFRTRGNVYVGWSDEPTASELRAVEGCLH
jgi:hypothetical protein